MTFYAHKEEDLKQIAEQLLKNYADYRIFAFFGEMGAGKTTFIKELCKQLGVTNVTSSPSFAIINEYMTETGVPVYHFDFYRINNRQEVIDIGFSDYLCRGNYCFIEWTEKVIDFLFDDYLQITMEVDTSHSRIFKVIERKIR